MEKFRQREITETIAVVFTKTGNQDLNEWDVECLDRDRGVNGHGAHFLILRDGEVVETRDADMFGNVIWHMDDESVYVRVVGDAENMTEEQETELDHLLANLEHRYGAKVIYD